MSHSSKSAVFVSLAANVAIAMLLFFVSGVYSIMEGAHRVFNPEPLEHAGLAVGILLFAVILEAKSLAECLKALKEERGNDTLMQWVKNTKDTGLMIITGENAAALGGLAIALLAIGASLVTGNPVYDALGSIAVGVLLIALAGVLTKEIHSLIIGESAGKEVEDEIREICASNGFVVLNLITIQYGKQVMVALKALPVRLDDMTGDDLIDAVNITEANIKAALPQVGWNFFEVDKVK